MADQPVHKAINDVKESIVNWIFDFDPKGDDPISGDAIGEVFRRVQLPAMEGMRWVRQVEEALRDELN